MMSNKVCKFALLLVCFVFTGVLGACYGYEAAAGDEFVEEVVECILDEKDTDYSVYDEQSVLYGSIEYTSVSNAHLARDLLEILWLLEAHLDNVYTVLDVVRSLNRDVIYVDMTKFTVIDRRADAIIARQALWRIFRDDPAAFWAGIRMDRLNFTGHRDMDVLIRTMCSDLILIRMFYPEWYAEFADAIAYSENLDRNFWRFFRIFMISPMFALDVREWFSSAADDIPNVVIPDWIWYVFLNDTEKFDHALTVNLGLTSERFWLYYLMALEIDYFRLNNPAKYEAVNIVLNQNPFYLHRDLRIAMEDPDAFAMQHRLNTSTTIFWTMSSADDLTWVDILRHWTLAMLLEHYNEALNQKARAAFNQNQEQLLEIFAVLRTLSPWQSPPLELRNYLIASDLYPFIAMTGYFITNHTDWVRTKF